MRMMCLDLGRSYHPPIRVLVVSVKGHLRKYEAADANPLAVNRRGSFWVTQPVLNASCR